MLHVSYIVGDNVCIPDGASPVNVRRPDGSEVWHTTPTTPTNSLYFPFLSPDEHQVVVAGAGAGTTEAWARMWPPPSPRLVLLGLARLDRR